MTLRSISSFISHRKPTLDYNGRCVFVSIKTLCFCATEKSLISPDDFGFYRMLQSVERHSVLGGAVLFLGLFRGLSARFVQASYFTILIKFVYFRV